MFIVTLIWREAVKMVARGRWNFDWTLLSRGEMTCLVSLGVGVMVQLEQRHRQIAKKPTNNQKTAAQQM